MEHEDYCPNEDIIPRKDLPDLRELKIQSMCLHKVPKQPLIIPTEFDYDGAPCPEYAHHYSVGPFLKEEMYARMVMWPITTKPNLAPAINYENEKYCVEQRIKLIRNKKATLSGSFRARVKRFASLVMKHVIKTTGTECVYPYSIADTLERMPRKDRAEYLKDHVLDREKLHSNLKKETYPEVKPPRNISGVEPDHLLTLSQYTYAFDDVLHAAQIPWYMPGSNPHEVGSAVARVTQSPYVGADISKMDGRQNKALRSPAIQVLKRMLPPDHQHRFMALCHREMNLTATTPHGVKYKVDGTMCSGSPLTTLGNTLLNGFFYYLSLTKHHATDDEIWKAMCEKVICYGDDSIGPEYAWDSYDRIMTAKGMVVKKEDCSDGATFLGRLYPFDGKPDSVADARRLFPKIHITCASGPINQLACNRAIGLRTANPQEWWITKICRYIERTHGDLGLSEEYLSRYEWRTLKAGPYPEWGPDTEQHCIRLMCKWFNLTEEEFDEHINLYDGNEIIRAPWVNNGTHEFTQQNIWYFDPYHLYEPFHQL